MKHITHPIEPKKNNGLLYVLIIIGLIILFENC